MPTWGVEGATMGLADMKKALHDRLWNAQERWFALREQGATKRELKLKGIRECGDPNRYTRNLIFAGATRRAYEDTLKSFLEFAHERFGAQRLEDIGKREFTAFIENGIARGLAASTLEARVSHLAKYGCLTGQAQSFIALGQTYAGRIRELHGVGALPRPVRVTPSPEVAGRAVEILESWDRRHTGRTGQPRAYHLAAKLQVETAARSVSVTDRLTRSCLKGGNRIEIVGKGGRRIAAEVSPDLYIAVQDHLEKAGEPLADRRSYQMAWRRAVRAAGGRAAGTHGLRRLSAREFYTHTYRKMTAAGAPPEQARREAREETIARLGHSRDRTDQAACYLGDVA